MDDGKEQRRKHTNIAIALAMVLLSACATTPKPTPAGAIPELELIVSLPPRMGGPVLPEVPVRECELANLKPTTAFHTLRNGARTWVVTFDRATTNRLFEVSEVPDGLGLKTEEVECQLDKQLRQECPHWTKGDDEDGPAVLLFDGRFRSRGYCDSESAQLGFG
jgi:hypothetical protein